MPIFESDDPRAWSLFNEPGTLPSELIRNLRNLGFQVDRRRQWAPVGENPDLPVLVPIEELRVTPVSNRSYQ
jgi:hypothetical protein